MKVFLILPLAQFTPGSYLRTHSSKRRKEMKEAAAPGFLRKVTYSLRAVKGNHLQTEGAKNRKIHNDRGLQGEGSSFVFCFAFFLERRWKGERTSRKIA